MARPGERPPTAPECYRFVLSNPSVDVCMMGAKDHEETRENLNGLDTSPMTEEGLVRMRRIGDYVHGGRRTIHEPIFGGSEMKMNSRERVSPPRDRADLEERT